MSDRRPGMKIKKDPTDIAGMEDRTYSLAEVAAIFEVNIQTVRAWCRKGEMKATLAPSSRAGGGYKVSLESMKAFAIKRYMS